MRGCKGFVGAVVASGVPHTIHPCSPASPHPGQLRPDPLHWRGFTGRLQLVMGLPYIPESADNLLTPWSENVYKEFVYTCIYLVAARRRLSQSTR